MCIIKYETCTPFMSPPLYSHQQWIFMMSKSTEIFEHIRNFIFFFQLWLIFLYPKLLKTTALIYLCILRFFLLVSVCYDVAELLVVDVASWVNRCKSEGLINLQVHKGNSLLLKCIYINSFCIKVKKNKPLLLWIYPPGSSVVV